MWLVRRTPAWAEDREISKISAESIVDALEGEYWVDLVTDHPVFHSLDLTYMVSDMSISDDGETLTYMYVDQYISVPLSDISTHVDQIVPRYMAEAV